MRRTHQIKIAFIVIIAIIMMLSVILTEYFFTQGSSPTPSPEVSFIYNPYRSVIYQIVTDRFFYGNLSNDQPYYNPRSLYMYHGGDFEGIIKKLDYLKDLGIGAIWISPPFDNVNKLIGNVASYHGYWPRDYTKPDEHFGTWNDFKRLCSEAHKRGIAVIIDVVPNHTNPYDMGEYGALYYFGRLVTAYITDKYSYNSYEGSYQGIFHHNGNIGGQEWDIPWNTRYKNLFDLADLNQMNNAVDKMLKNSLKMWIVNGSSGIRIDAAKHMDPMWLRSYYAEAIKVAPVFSYAEWYITSVRGSLLYWDALRLQEIGGVAILNIPLRGSIVQVFAHGRSFELLNNELTTELNDLKYDYLLVNFLDNHDLPRYLKEGGNITTMHMAMAFVMTIPGVPVVYYGDEIYLRYNGSGSGDPYNRLQMVFTKENNKTTMARLIKELSKLRRISDALAYGKFKTIYVDNDVYIYARDLPWETIIIALSRTNRSIEVPLNSLKIPNGVYKDYLGGLLGGTTATVTNNTLSVSMFPYTVSIWYIKKEQSLRSPYIGASLPNLVIPGAKLIIFGRGFNLSTNVLIKTDLGDYTPKILLKNNSYILLQVPTNLNSRRQFVSVIVASSSGKSSIELPFRARDARPIVLRIKDIPKDFITGFKYIFISTDLGELEIPIPTMISSDGTIFAILDVRPSQNVRINIYTGYYSGGSLKYLGSIYISTQDKYVSISLKNLSTS